MGKVCAVVVTYNRKEKLEKCILKLLNQQGSECDILVVDNDSNDGTREMINDSFLAQGVIYYNTGANLGGAGGFEFGVKEAVSRGYDYIWIMDDDTWPSETALAELFKADKLLSGNWGFLSSIAYWTDGTICRMNIQKRNIFKHVGKKEYKTNISPIEMCSFVSLLVKSEIVRELGLPIGEYFIWTDDYEFTGRISRKYRCYMVTDSKVVHAMDRHIRVDFARDDSSRLERYHYIYRNDVHCYRQYGIWGWLYIFLKNIYTILNVLLHANSSKLDRIRIVIQGMIEGISFNPSIRKVN